MTSQRSAKTVDYPRLIARHLETRLRALPRNQVDRVLELTGLQWTGSVVSLRSGAPVSAETSRRYKQAVGEVFGSAAQGMTQVNFMLAGCKCDDCQRAVLDDGSGEASRSPSRG